MAGSRRTDLHGNALAFSAFEAGVVFQMLQSVALGVKPAASGEIRTDATTAFLELVRNSGFTDLFVGFGVPIDGRIEWRVSKFAWGLEALAWLGAGGRAEIPPIHLHWIQGLLFGYCPSEIDRYLSTQDVPASSSQPSRPRSNKAETFPAPTTG